MSDSTLPAKYPERLKTPAMNFHLAMDVALGVDVDVILESYRLQHHEYLAVLETPAFKAQLNALEQDIAKNGGSFRLKAQAQAEVLLEESFRLAMDPEVGAQVRADLIKQNVRWAGFDQPEQKGSGSGAGFTINLNLGGAQPQGVTIEHEGGPNGQ